MGLFKCTMYMSKWLTHFCFLHVTVSVFTLPVKNLTGFHIFDVQVCLWFLLKKIPPKSFVVHWTITNIFQNHKTICSTVACKYFFFQISNTVFVFSLSAHKLCYRTSGLSFKTFFVQVIYCEQADVSRNSTAFNRVVWCSQE